MRAAVLHEPHDLRIEEVPQPICGPQDLKIKVIYNGLCGTDATEYTKGPMMVPLTRHILGAGMLGQPFWDTSSLAWLSRQAIKFKECLANVLPVVPESPVATAQCVAQVGQTSVLLITLLA